MTPKGSRAVATGLKGSRLKERLKGIKGVRLKGSGIFVSVYG